MKQRVYYIDFIRGVGILLMVFAHIPVGGEFNHITYAFHMPLFFFVSGYLYKENTTLFNIKGKFIKLMPSYIFFAMLGYMLWLIEFKPINICSAVAPFFHIFLFNNDGMPIVGAIWFITALLVSESIYFFLRKHIHNEFLLLLSCMVLFTISLLIESIHINFPFSINQALIGLIFFHFGFLSAKYNINNLSRFPVIIVIMFVLGGSLAYYNGDINMRLSKYSNPSIFLLTALILIFTLWIFSNYLYTKKLRFKIIEKIGRYSVIWLGTNEIVINITKSFINKMDLEFFKNIFVLLILITSIEYFIQELVLHSKIKKLLKL